MDHDEYREDSGAVASGRRIEGSGDCSVGGVAGEGQRLRRDRKGRKRVVT